jgi:hypothetical protein
LPVSNDKKIMKSLLTKTAFFASIASLAFATQAYALSIDLTDTRYLGWVDPSVPASNAGEVGSINDLRTVLPTGDNPAVLTDIDGVVNNANIGRTGVSVVGLPVATTTGADGNNNPSASVDVTGFTYLLGKYGDTGHIWYVGGLSGVQTIPLNEPDSLGGQGQSHYSLFNPTPSTGVPDGGATVLLLGAALSALAFVGRRFHS